MKKFVGDPNMSPFGHALAVLVPFYGIFRVHAHFRLLDAMLLAAKSARRVNMPIAVGAYTIYALWSTLSNVVNLKLDSTTTLLITAALASFASGYGQARLNDFYDAVGVRAERKVHALEWILLVVGGLFAVYLFEVRTGRL